jgi:hypothetical protein
VIIIMPLYVPNASPVGFAEIVTDTVCPAEMPPPGVTESQLPELCGKVQKVVDAPLFETPSTNDALLVELAWADSVTAEEDTESRDGMFRLIGAVLETPLMVAVRAAL